MEQSRHRAHPGHPRVGSVVSVALAGARPRVALSHLARVTTLRLEARWLEADGSYGVGEGVGRAVCRWEGRGRVVVEERGRWSPRRGVTLPFRRSYRCWIDGSCIALESLGGVAGRRLAPLRLAHDASDTWRSHAPQRCGADLYQARVTFATDRIAIRWDVRGPAKLYTLRVTYDLAAPAGRRAPGGVRAMS